MKYRINISWHEDVDGLGTKAAPIFIDKKYDTFKECVTICDTFAKHSLKTLGAIGILHDHPDCEGIRTWINSGKDGWEIDSYCCIDTEH